MKRLLAWAAAAALSSAGAVLMLASALRDARAQASADVVAPRDASKIPPAELELVALKIREGDLLAIRKDLPGARRAWTEARSLGRGLWPAHEGLADSYAKNKLHADAEREYVTAEQLADGKPRDVIRVKRARNLRTLGRDAEALDLLLAVNSPQLTRDMVEVADGRVERVADRAARDPWLWYVVHAVHAKAKRAPEAAKALARYVVEVAPWDRALVNRALELLRAEKLVDEAVAVCRGYARSTPEDIAIHETTGDLLAGAGRIDEALVAYTSLVDLRPVDPAIRGKVAGLLRKLGRPDDALLQYEAAERLAPNEAAWPREMARVHAERGRLEAAQRCLENACLRGGDAGARSELTDIYRRQLAEHRNVDDLRRHVAALGLTGVMPLEEQLRAPDGPREDGAAVLLLVDTSSSMESHLERAKEEVLALVARLEGRRVVVGVSEFATVSGKPTVRTVVPFGPPSRSSTERAVAALRHDGGSPIGPAMVAGAAELNALRRRTAHLVVITDEDTGEGVAPAEVLRAIERLPADQRPRVHYLKVPLDARALDAVVID